MATFGVKMTRDIMTVKNEKISTSPFPSSEKYYLKAEIPVISIPVINK